MRRAFDYEITDRGVRIIFPAAFDRDDIAATFERVAADPRFVPGSDCVCDARATEVSPSATEIAGMLESFHAARPHFSGRWAVLVSDPLRFGLARMGSAMAEPMGLELRPFVDVDAAWAWLESARGPQTHDRT